MHIFEHITTMREKAWGWFAARAAGPYALFWLCVVAFTETFISPIMPEPLMAAMLLVNRDRWKWYAFCTTVFSTLGGLTGYLLGYFLFRGFGEYLLGLSGAGEAHSLSQTILGGNIFVIMFFIAFTLLPDKPFTYLSGFLGVPLFLYLGGLFAGRALRVFIVAYVVYRFGPQILTVINKYFWWLAVGVLAIFAFYVTLQLHLLPWQH